MMLGFFLAYALGALLLATTTLLVQPAGASPATSDATSTSDPSHSSEQLPVNTTILLVYEVFALGRANINVSRVARTILVEAIMFRVRCWAPHVRSSENMAPPLPWGCPK